MSSINIAETPDWRTDEGSSSAIIEEVSQKIDAVNFSNQTDEQWYRYYKEICVENELKSEEEASKNVNAMKKLNTTFRGSGTRVLTEQIVCELHKIVMLGLIRNPGEYRRETEVTNQLSYAHTTRPDGTVYFYLNPFKIESSMYGIFDEHNKSMKQYSDEIKSFNTKEKLTYLIKHATWLFCCVMTVHPFSDGNGRLCRLLANYVLAEVMPFPFPMYNIPNTRITKDIYFKAIIEYQKEKSFSYVAAILVDGLSYSIKKYAPQAN